MPAASVHSLLAFLNSNRMVIKCLWIVAGSAPAATRARASCLALPEISKAGWSQEVTVPTEEEVHQEIQQGCSCAEPTEKQGEPSPICPEATEEQGEWISWPPPKSRFRVPAELQPPALSRSDESRWSGLGESFHEYLSRSLRIQAANITHEREARLRGERASQTDDEKYYQAALRVQQEYLFEMAEAQWTCLIEALQRLQIRPQPGFVRVAFSRLIVPTLTAEAGRAYRETCDLLLSLHIHPDFSYPEYFRVERHIENKAVETYDHFRDLTAKWAADCQTDAKQSKKLLSLGPKKVDLSKYLENAKLTEKQHTIASLHYEYCLGVVAISRRLGVDHSVVSEQLIAVKRVLGRDEELQKYLKKQAAKARRKD